MLTSMDLQRRSPPRRRPSPSSPGWPRRKLQQFMDLWIDTERVVTLFSQGVNQSSSGTDKVNAILNCHLATGRIGKPGSGPFSVTGQGNAMGGREVTKAHWSAPKRNDKGPSVPEWRCRRGGVRAPQPRGGAGGGALVFFVGALFGLVAFLDNLIPEAAVAPFLDFVGISVIAVSFRSCAPKHHIAIAIAFIPHVSAIIVVKWGAIVNALRGSGSCRYTRRPSAQLRGGCAIGLSRTLRHTRRLAVVAERAGAAHEPSGVVRTIIGDCRPGSGAVRRRDRAALASVGTELDSSSAVRSITPVS